jgi:hypothetical protein
LTAQSHLTPSRQERQVFYGVMQGRAFSLAALRLGVSHALESDTADWANGFILPILYILSADQPG